MLLRAELLFDTEQDTLLIIAQPEPDEPHPLSRWTYKPGDRVVLLAGSADQTMLLEGYLRSANPTPTLRVTTEADDARA